MKQKANLIFVSKNKSGEYIFFLSRRSKDAKMFSDYFSFWGGGIEHGELPEQAMIREIKEELDYIVTDAHYLGTYNTPGVLKWVYYLVVKKDLVDQLPIFEGQYGQWFTRTEIEKEVDILKEDVAIIKEIDQILL